MFSIIGLSSCGEDRIPEMEKKQENQRWIYETMDKHYYWYQDMPELKEEDLWKRPKVLFESLLSNKDGYRDSNGRNVHFSYLEDFTEDLTTRAIGNSNNSYGFDFYYVTVEVSNINYGWVTFVQPDSPAAKAGLMRNDRIMEVNGVAVSSSNNLQLSKGGEAIFTINRNRNISKLKIPASTKINNTPLLICKKINSDLGYILYNHFSYDPDEYANISYKDGVYLKEMVEEVSALKGVQDLILDFRYNPGGELNTANTLISMICPDNSLNIGLASLERNDKTNANNNSKVKAADFFLKETGATNLNIQNLFVLVSPYTASASEYVINALSPFMKVHVIGAKTVGKNVGSETFTSNDMKLRMHPITVKIFNSLGLSEYGQGFEPGYYYLKESFSNALYESKETDFELGELGTNNDPLFRKALQVRAGATASKTRSESSTPANKRQVIKKLSTVEKYGNNIKIKD